MCFRPTHGTRATRPQLSWHPNRSFVRCRMESRWRLCSFSSPIDQGGLCAGEYDLLFPTIPNLGRGRGCAGGMRLVEILGQDPLWSKLQHRVCRHSEFDFLGVCAAFQPGQLKGQHPATGDYTLVFRARNAEAPCTASKSISPSPLETPPTSTSMVDTRHITLDPQSSKDTRSSLDKDFSKPVKKTTKSSAFVVDEVTQMNAFKDVPERFFQVGIAKANTWAWPQE